MRIYSAKILAAVAFISCLSRCSSSGSKAVGLDVPSSDHSDSHHDDIGDDIVQEDDEEASEARMISSGGILASAEKLQAIKLPEPSGTLSQGLDLTLRLGKESHEPSETVAKTLSQEPNHPSSLDPSLRLGKELAPVVVPRLVDIQRIIKCLEKHTDPEVVTPETWESLKITSTDAGDRTLHELMSALVTKHGYSYDGFIRLVSVFRKAKASGLSADEARAVEEEMLGFWADSQRVNVHEAFFLLGLNEVLKKGKGLTDDDLVMLEKFIGLYNKARGGRKARLHSSLLYILRGNYQRALQIIAHAEEKSELATMMLKGFIRDSLKSRKRDYRVSYLMGRLVNSEISESRIRHILPILREDPGVTKNEFWTEFETELQGKLDSGWPKASVGAVSTTGPKRKINTAWGIEIAPVRKKQAPKRKRNTASGIEIAPARKKRASKRKKSTASGIEIAPARTKQASKRKINTASGIEIVPARKKQASKSKKSTAPSIQR